MTVCIGRTERNEGRGSESLLGPERLSRPACTSSIVFCGDFNAIPVSLPYRNVLQRFQDVQRVLKNHRPRDTFFGRFSMIRIDHIFVDPRLEVGDAEVPKTALTRVAPDHLPLVAELRIPSTEID